MAYYDLSVMSLGGRFVFLAPASNTSACHCIIQRGCCTERHVSSSARPCSLRGCLRSFFPHEAAFFEETIFFPACQHDGVLGCSSRVCKPSGQESGCQGLEVDLLLRRAPRSNHRLTSTAPSPFPGTHAETTHGHPVRPPTGRSVLLSLPCEEKVPPTLRTAGCKAGLKPLGAAGKDRHRASVYPVPSAWTSTKTRPGPSMRAPAAAFSQDDALVLCYTSFLGPSFERLRITWPGLQKQTWLERQMQGPIPCTAPEDVSLGKPPTGVVTTLAPGHL
ncbi:uncharacterized protein LOC144180434 [Haemaphysalis longicornis]